MKKTIIYPNNNECQAEDGLNFNFSYDSTTDKHGYMDSNGDFIPFSSGGTDVSDTTATASTVLNGYYFYNSNGDKTEGTYIPLNTSDATARAKHIEAGYTAYARGNKIIGTAIVQHGSPTRYTGSITNLILSRNYLVATSNYNYAIFAGGNYSGYPVNYVDSYNEYLTKTNPSQLSDDRYDLAAATIGEYALFGGGVNSRDYSGYAQWRDTVDAYNSSLTLSNPSPLSSNRSRLSASYVGDYALFVGGYHGYYTYSYATSYSKSLTRSQRDYYNQLYFLTGVHLDNYALFGGGTMGSSNNNILYYYNTSLTRANISNALYGGTTPLSATAVGNYAIFVGDGDYNIDVFDASLTKQTATRVNYGKQWLAATTIDGYALFGGGYSGYHGAPTNTVEAYDTSLTHSDITTGLSVARMCLSATTIGDYAIFGGGSQSSNSGDYATVDAYYVP